MRRERGETQTSGSPGLTGLLLRCGEDQAERSEVCRSTVLQKILGSRERPSLRRISHPMITVHHLSGNHPGYEVELRDAHSRGFGQFCRLYPLCNGRSRLPLEAKRLLYLALIRPIFAYATPAWTFGPTSITRLQRFQNKILRSLTGACRYVRNSTLHRDLCVPEVLEFVRGLTLRLLASAAEVENPLIRDLGDYDAGNPHYRHRRQRALLGP